MKKWPEMSRLKFLLKYEPETGVFYWLNPTCSRVQPGDIAGHVNEKGYRHIGLDGGLYSASRLAWYYVTEKIPDKIVDHKNRNRDDNRWENLRLASRSENNANSRVKHHNVLGLKGVKETLSGRFAARIYKDKQFYCLGTYDTAEEAHQAYAKAAAQMHGDFAYPGCDFC